MTDPDNSQVSFSAVAQAHERLAEARNRVVEAAKELREWFELDARGLVSTFEYEDLRDDLIAAVDALERLEAGQ